MNDAFRPVLKQSLADTLAHRIRQLIQTGEYKQGDRLPAIMEMARSFGVGHPAVREALKKLETMGMVEIRHGSGVYVSRSEDVLVLASDYTGTVTKKLLLDLIRARIPIEMQSVLYAVRNASAEDLQGMRRLLDIAGQSLDNLTVLNSVNMGFHRQIALASGNMVLTQLLDVMQEMFVDEQRMIIGIFGSPQRDHQEHLALLEAIEQRDELLAVERMRKHLEGVEEAIHQWDPELHPVS